ncbi:MAG: hypothetical protein WDO14_14975 [Bacteroidota bacterium]
MTPDFEISNVWMKITPELGQEIIEFWTSNRMLKPNVDVQERAKQIVLTFRHKGKIVGLTSAGVVRYQPLNSNIFFIFRMIVLPEFRIPGIESKLIVETRDILEAFSEKQTENKCIGILTFVENPQLIAKRTKAVWPSSKMVFIGNDKSGRQIRLYYFKGVTI